MNEMEIAWYNKALLDVQEKIFEKIQGAEMFAYQALIDLQQNVASMYLPHKVKEEIHGSELP